MNFSEASLKTRSEKVVLCTIKALELVKLFDLDSGSQYKRAVTRFVSNVYQNGTALSAGTLPLSAGQYYYDNENGFLYVRCTDSSNPNTKKIGIEYKFFFSSTGHNLPNDLSSGFDVHWEGRLSATGSVKQSLDDENIGVVVESKSSITLINSDGYFDEIYDTLIWDNKDCAFYSWIVGTPITEAQKLFDGVVIDKNYSTEAVSFQLSDFTFRLRDFVDLELFSSSDGDLDDSDLDKPKRRIFGRIDKAATIGIDKTIDGYSIAETATGSIGDNFVTFSASVLGKIFQGDKFVINVLGDDIEFSVSGFTSSTVLQISDTIETAFSAEAVTVKPEKPHRSKNRNWHIAGHPLFQPSATIDEIISPNRFRVSSTDGWYAGDRVTINSITTTIRRISGDIVVLSQVIAPAPAVNDTIIRLAVNDIYFGNNLLQPDRDYSLDNSTEAIINLDPLAEFNITPQLNLSGTTIVFTNGSTSLTSTSATLDLRTILKPRGWIRSSSVSHTTWYELAEVNEFTAKIVSSFSGTTQTQSAFYKIPEIINDDSLISVSCYGISDSGVWVKTPSDCVKYLIENDAAFLSIDTASFSKASSDCDYIVSMIVPESIGDGAPSIRETISKISEGVFGSLYTTSAFNIAYNILNSTKPESLSTITDDDIYSFSVETKNQIVNKVRLSYRPQIDVNNGESSFSVYNYTSTFVNDNVGVKNTKEVVAYIYEDDKATILAQRHAFFRSLSASRVSVKAGMIFATKSLNDKIFINLDRLYKRYGGRDRRKIGSIASISKNGTGVDVEFNDLGNVFNRVPSVAPNTQSGYSSSSDDDIAKWGFVTDNNTETPDTSSEDELGNNLVG